MPAATRARSQIATLQGTSGAHTQRMTGGGATQRGTRTEAMPPRRGRGIGVGLAVLVALAVGVAVAITVGQGGGAPIPRVQLPVPLDRFLKHELSCYRMRGLPAHP